MTTNKTNHGAVDSVAQSKVNYDELISQLSPEVYGNFKRAIELGKWPDGNKVSSYQKEHCIAAIIAYEKKYLPEKDRVGYIDRGTKSEGELCNDELNDNTIKPLKWS